MKNFFKLFIVVFTSMTFVSGVVAQSTQTGLFGAGHSPGVGGVLVRYVGWDASLASNLIPLNIEHRGTQDINFLNGAFPGTNRMTILGTASGATQGFVGIGTTIPVFHLSLDNDGGILAQGTISSGAIIPPGLTSERMFWYPYKGSFRAGNATLGEWDDANIGIYSVAFGERTTASGQYSSASGRTTIASGTGSFAIGAQNAIASGNGSFAGGFDISATNIGDFVFGENSFATGGFSTCFGAAAQAN